MWRGLARLAIATRTFMFATLSNPPPRGTLPAALPCSRLCVGLYAWSLNRKSRRYCPGYGCSRMGGLESTKELRNPVPIRCRLGLPGQLANTRSALRFIAAVVVRPVPGERPPSLRPDRTCHSPGWRRPTMRRCFFPFITLALCCRIELHCLCYSSHKSATAAPTLRPTAIVAQPPDRIRPGARRHTG